MGLEWGWGEAEGDVARRKGLGSGWGDAEGGGVRVKGLGLGVVRLKGVE